MIPRIKTRFLLLCGMVISIFLVNIPSAKADIAFPVAERAIFVLDLSGSTDSKGLWQLGLRPSVINKLSDAFGYPVRKGISHPKAPTDISVTVIDSNSRLAPLIKIVSAEDSQKIWGLIINKIGKNPTSIRLNAIVTDFFGESGAYTELANKYLLGDKPPQHSQSGCQVDAERALSRGTFMDDVDKELRTDSARTLCEVIIKIAVAMSSADSIIKDFKCSKSSCSDVVGAVLRTTALAQDAFKRNQNSKMCIAIASDMINNFPAMTSSSALNTLRVVKSSKSVEEAEKKGSDAASVASVKFPIGMKVRVSIIGQGSSSAKGIPIDRMSFLDAYWRGFWNAAGIKSTAQAASLSEACY